MKLRLVAAAFALVLSSCGDPTVKITNDSYEPRIVVEGLLLPGNSVSGIRITRNFMADHNINSAPIVIDDAIVAIVDVASGASYALSFHAGADLHTTYYEYPGDDLTILPGGTYRLEVSARIDGQTLSTRATTTVPAAGFRIASISHDRLPYRPRAEDGEFVDVKVQIERSPGTSFYLLTTVPVDPSVENFIFDNAFTDDKPDDLSPNDIVDFSYNYEWIQNTPPTAGISTMDVFWWDLWFYGEHRVVIYAADDNYARFLQTFDEVQEEDGNFHEPVFSFEGDGMGYFGSAIADTVGLTITR